MIVTAKSEYAIRALIELAVSEEKLPSHEIAHRQNIPEVYLKQILATLKQSGLLDGERGAHGGYRLARDPKEITLRQVVELIEGEIKDSHCHEYGKQNCGEFYYECKLREVWDEALGEFLKVLDRFTIAQFAELKKKSPSLVPPPPR